MNSLLTRFRLSVLQFLKIHGILLELVVNLQSLHLLLPHNQYHLQQLQRTPSGNRQKRSKKTSEDSILKIFKECDGTARQYERERDRIAEELERERIRQGDVELQLQAQWLDFMKEVLNVVVTYLGKRN
ncbi:hypothetical protein ACJJTC_010609 [Scirpophaga incertulas]